VTTLEKTRPLEGEIIPPGRHTLRHETADIEKLAEWLDTKFAIPGLGWRFGMDSIIGLVPGIGDAITGGLGIYIMGRAHQLGAPKLLLARMGWNVFFDMLLGAIPIVGDLFDLANKSNARNVRLLMRHLERERR